MMSSSALLRGLTLTEQNKQKIDKFKLILMKTSATHLVVFNIWMLIFIMDPVLIFIDIFF